MKRRATAILSMTLVAVACGSPSSTPTSAPPATTSSSMLPATSTSPTTSTTLSPFTTTPVIPQFEPREPTEQEHASWVLVALVALENTPWSPDEMGNTEWAGMLRDGAISGCEALFGGFDLPAVMFALLQATPVAGVNPHDLDDNVFQLMLAIAASGMPLYCPDLTNGFDDALALTNTWLELTGEEPIQPSP